MKYTAVIAAKNEAVMLPGCLASLGGAEEVIVIDDESSDQTVEIARAAGAKVLNRKLDGFATQKNFGISKASNKWVLIIDADERLSSALAEEIRGLTPEPGVVAYSMPFRNHIGRRWLRYGGLYPDRHTRLFDKRHAKYGAREIHEELEVNGATLDLKYDFIHYTYTNWREYRQKVNKYSQAQAIAESKLGTVKHASNPTKAWLRELYFRLLQLQGYRDGWAGLRSALMLALYQYKYWKTIRGIK